MVLELLATLQEERREVMQALLEQDCIPAGMELFTAEISIPHYNVARTACTAEIVSKVAERYADRRTVVDGANADVEKVAGDVARFLRDVIESNHDGRNFRLFGPDETLSNRLDPVFEVTDRQLDRGGKVIIPAFAVGRTQELVYNLNRMHEDGDLHNVPVYVDSPLAVNASDVFKQHPECFDVDMLRQIRSGHPAQEFKNLTYIHSLDESKALNERKDPMIIISASGMAEVGRIVYHIRWAIESPRNTIMIVGWQAPYTMGRRLADREERVRIFGDTYNVRAEIATIGGLSAHAGQDLLTEYGLAVRKSARQTFLVHGEERAAMPLKEKLSAGGLREIYYPQLGDSAEI